MAREGHILDSLPPGEVGRELQKARSACGLTQQQAADVLGVARTTIVAMEKGDRRIQAGELIKLARAYGRQVNDFVRPRPKVASFAAQFRGPTLQTDQDKADIAPSVFKLEELSRNYLELEQLTKAPAMKKYPPEYPISGISPLEAAQSVAMEERNRLGLGDGPVPLLRDILEQDVGLRIFYFPLSTRFSAMYGYNEQLGGCIAVNSSHPEERRRWSLAHDYGHFLVHRYKPHITLQHQPARKAASETFADSFARYFLMPASGLSRRYTDIRRTRGKITPADLLTLGHYYGVSFEALTRHLEDLKLLPTGTGDKLRANGPKIRESQQQLGLDALPARAEKLPLRYQHLALEALDTERISEGQFARFLEIDRLEARTIAERLRRQSDALPGGTSTDLHVTQPVGE